jgi:hypothetical protein
MNDYDDSKPETSIQACEAIETLQLLTLLDKEEDH